MTDHEHIALNFTAPDVPAPGKFVQTSLGSAHYVMHGSPSADVVVVFVHGLGSYHFHFEYLLPEVAALNVCCIAVDLFGFGYSDGLALEDYTPESYVRQIDEILESVGLESKPMGLIAHSMGGAVICHYAYTHPEKTILWKVMMAPAGVMNGGLLGFYKSCCGCFQNIMFNFTQNRERQKRNWVAGYCHPERFPQKIDWLIGKLEWQRDHNRNLRTAVQTLMNQFPFGGAESEKVIATVGRATTPVLICWGDYDQTVSIKCADKFKELMPYAKFITYKECGHGILIEATQRVVPDILDFIRSSMPSSSQR